MNRTPLIVAMFLLLLPVLYVGSYLALVSPGDYSFHTTTSDSEGTRNYVHGYRYFGAFPKMDELLDKPELMDEAPWGARICPIVFWPLEQIDRRVRPQTWTDETMDRSGFPTSDLPGPFVPKSAP